MSTDDKRKVLGEVIGVVVEGDHRGRRLGYPTANVLVDPGCTLANDGIYAGRVERSDGTVYDAAISIGTRPTYYQNGGTRVLEAYLLSFEGDLYGERVRVECEAFVRSQRAFTSDEELTAQIGADIEEVRQHASKRLQ